MPDNVIERLIETFRRFPGIGPRQARRFVFHLLRAGRGSIERLAADLRELHAAVAQCEECFRFYSTVNQSRLIGQAKICDLCRDASRDKTIVMVVEKDADLETIRQAGIYQGDFFVLGGLIPILEKSPHAKVRLRELLIILNKRLTTGLKEVIIALAVNPEGDQTVEYLKQALEELAKNGLKLTVLGRGLSTGTELEYSDAETIKNALKNRA